MFLQILIAGFVVGSCYSIVSVGMTILYQATTILNFGHGETVMIGAFLYIMYSNMFRIHIAIPLTIISCYILGALMNRIVFRQLIRAPHLNVVLATCAFLYVFRGLARMIWKSEPQFPPALIAVPPIKWLGAMITSQDIVIFACVFILIIFFVWIFLFTETGLKMRAASQNLKGASLVGINIDSFFTNIWGASVGAGAIAGILLGPMFSVSPDMGEGILLRAFAAMTLGGFGNIGGAAIGGFLIGIIENLAALYIWTPLREIIAYLAIVFILIFKPTGILGLRKF